MSGGRFDYVQFRFGEIVESIRSIIADNDSNEKGEWGDTIGYHLPPDIISKFAETADMVEKAQKMVTRVDWLLSGDDGEDCFRRRWEEEGLGHSGKRIICADCGMVDCECGNENWMVSLNVLENRGRLRKKSGG